MKLRILGDSIRLRISKGELAALAATGTVSDAIHFGPDSRLCYRLSARGDTPPGASFADGAIDVVLPEADVRELAETDRVSIRGEQALSGQASLSILVEKDFECLVPRPGEDPRDLFDNPARS